MELAEAREILNSCVREELQDHAFGDAEVFWSRNYVQIADGHFSGTTANVWFKTIGGESTASFYGQPALELRYCGTEGIVYRNDETGPDNYVEGHVSPGLTKEAVFEELTKPVNVFERGVDL